MDMLVDRDVKEKFKNPLFNNVWEYKNKLRDFYDDEFYKNWVKNLKIVKNN
jgi:hypothetical protein